MLFRSYKQYPEYQKVNKGMSLDDFKNIFYWEYSHRLLGRLIGVLFAVPFFIFMARRKIKRALKPHLWTMLILGGCQGLLGWWMVKSGLIDNPDVSHYRLTAHLGLAILIYIYMFWVALRLVMPIKEKTFYRPTKLATAYVVIIFIQILLGGLVAGLNAGLVSDTWPLMFGSLIPDGLLGNSPWYSNFLDNPLTLHFEHRTFAYAVLIVAVTLWWKLHNENSSSVKLASYLVLFTILLQITLGVLTVINMVPIPLAAAHQIGAVLTLSAALFLLNRVRS